MDTAIRERLQQALFPSGSSLGTTRSLSVWAVLDGARDPAIHRALFESRLEHRCLFTGRGGLLSRELELAAPQLVELPPGHALGLRLLDEGWGQSWGIWLRIADPSNLRHHLRTLLRVQDEDGQRMLFRWYDPRVLRLYLPTCTPDELRQFFGPIDSLMLEAEGGAGLIEYRRHNGLLQQRRLSLAEAAEPDRA
ncbi:conserved hypothetical protein [Rubrivivax sp. A210]|uniref:DUF4123 domain-containing protein n=1 Tax=Rubrivivax sp. A210 TaxID=2772301 RepID=UPI001918AE6D|nr:DUF4123 domain-containing protein [Rubrivivax sp. A210]CAD5367190.1 conserved hypothetical protein [Rubrivivax sp. A210]